MPLGQLPGLVWREEGETCLLELHSALKNREIKYLLTVSEKHDELAFP